MSTIEKRRGTPVRWFADRKVGTKIFVALGIAAIVSVSVTWVAV